MKIYTLLVVGLALSVAACTGKEQASPTEAKISAEAEAALQRAARGDEVGTEAFIRHMHAHARQLVRLNDALAEGNLGAALTPAYWLSRHDEVSAPKESWQPYMEKMRAAARAVENAPDLGTARTAAKRISEGCQGCHREAGVEVDIAAVN